MVEALNKLSLNAQDMHNKFSTDWKDYQGYKIDGKFLLSEFKHDFEPYLRDILFHLNDAINLYSFSWGNDNVDVMLQEVDNLRNYFEDLESRADKAESKLENLVGQLAEEKYMSKELRSREYANQKL